MRRSPLVVAACIVFLLLAPPVAGQESGGDPKAYAGLRLQVGQAKGRFAD